MINNHEAILSIKNHMDIHKLNEPHAYHIHEALELAIKALENMGCGCDLCLSHNNMKCWKAKNA